MLYYGDEVGYVNDYSYLNDTGKSYDNRWMHRPHIDWKKNAMVAQNTSIESKIFKGLQRLLSIRTTHEIFSDRYAIDWLHTDNRSVVGFKKSSGGKHVFCLFNYSPEEQTVSYYVFDTIRAQAHTLFDLWSSTEIKIKENHDSFLFRPYQFYVLVTT